METNIKYRISVTVASLITVIALLGIVYFKIVSNEIVHTAGYYVFSQESTSGESAQSKEAAETTEKKTEPRSATNSNSNAGNGNGSHQHSSSGNASAAKSPAPAANKKTNAAAKTTAAPTEAPAETVTQRKKVFDSVFVYSDDTKKIHSRGCPYVNNINEENYYYINSESADELFEQGYEFCSYCKGYVIN